MKIVLVKVRIPEIYPELAQEEEKFPFWEITDIWKIIFKKFFELENSC